MVYRSPRNRRGKALGLHGAGISRAYRSSDAFVLGRFYQSRVAPEEEGWVMPWISVEKVAHLTSGLTHKARDCRSCHTPEGRQQYLARYRWLGSAKHMYQDVHHGQYRVVADEKGLRVVDLKALDPDDQPARGLDDKQDVFHSRPADYRIKPVKDEELAAREELMKRFLALEKGAGRIVRAAAVRNKPFAYQASELLDRARAQAHHGDLKLALELARQVLALRKKF